MSVVEPTRERELGLLEAGYRYVAGMDEVGRGALAGPVTVGVAVVGEGMGEAPSGVRDSKLLTAKRRQALVAPLRAWALAYGVGHAGPGEIDELGIMGGLALAGQRALEQVAARGVWPDVVLLDGNYNWLYNQPGLGELAEPQAAPSRPVPAVISQVKADMNCTVVAAASVLAKCERDEMMRNWESRYPGYGFSANKGYAAPAHVEGLAQLGPCQLHRRSWKLPGI